MAQRRDHPYILAIWLPTLHAGQNSCEWVGWFKTQHHGWTKAPSDCDQTQWLTRHTALIHDQRLQWEDPDYTVSVEGQNSFRLQGTSATLAGKPALIAANDEEAVIIDVKTGQENPSQTIQVMIYLHAVPKVVERYQVLKFAGQIAYPDRIVDVPAAAVDTAFVPTLGPLIRQCASHTPATPVPSSQECNFCDITAADCPERVDHSLLPETSNTADFSNTVRDHSKQPAPHEPIQAATQDSQFTPPALKTIFQGTIPLAEVRTPHRIGSHLQKYLHSHIIFSDRYETTSLRPARREPIRAHPCHRIPQQPSDYCPKTEQAVIISEPPSTDASPTIACTRDRHPNTTMPQRTRTPITATRTIRFYHLHGGRKIDLSYQQVDPAPLLNTAEQLSPEVPPSPRSRYMAGSSTRSFTTTDNPTDPVHFRFITTRVDNYPDDEVAATIAPLVLAQDHGLAETWHCVFRPPYTLAIAAQDTTTTAKRLEKYLREKNPTGPTVHIEPIASGNVIEQVMNMNPLSKVTIALRPRDVQTYINGLDTNKAIAAMADDCQSLTELLITYNPSPTGLGQFKNRILEPLVDFVSRPGTPKPKRLTARGHNDAASKSFAIDLLLYVSSVQKEIRKKPSPSGALNDNDAYTQIEAAITETFQYIDPERRDSTWFVVQTPGTRTPPYQQSLWDL